MLPPNCLTKHARNFRSSKTSQRVTDLEAATRQLRQISCILDSCTISASYEVSQAQQALLLLPHTAKGASTSSDTNELVASHRVSVFGFVLVLLCVLGFVLFAFAVCLVYDDDGLLDYVQVLDQFSFVALNSDGLESQFAITAFCNVI